MTGVLTSRLKCPPLPTRPSVTEDAGLVGPEKMNTPKENTHRTTRVNKCHAHLKTFPSPIFSYWCWFSLACTFQMWIPLIPSVNLKIFIVQIWLISLPPNLRNSHFLHWFSAEGLFKGKLRTKSILRNNFTFYFQISQSTCFLDRKTWMISKSWA